MNKKDAALARGRFAAARLEREALSADVAPMRAARHALIRQITEIDAEVRPLEALIRDAEKPIYVLDMEIAALARSLNGETAKPDKGNK